MRWSDGSESPTWEPLESINHRFPNVLLEDKEVAMEGGVDTIQPHDAEQQPAVDESAVESQGEGRDLTVVPPSIATTKGKRNVRRHDEGRWNHSRPSSNAAARR